MTEREKEQLLEEVLGGGDAAGLREATLAVGLRALKWRRRRRMAGYVSLLVLPLGVLLMRLAHEPKEVVVAQLSPVPSESKVERITTEELFALFPNRPLALVGKPGEQQLVFLDQPQQTTQ
jgi:hypothetical protein